MRIALEMGLNVEAPRGADVYFHGLIQGLGELEVRHSYVLFSFFYRDFEAKRRSLPQPRTPQFELRYHRWPEKLVRTLENAGLPAIDLLFARWADLSVYHCLGGVPPHIRGLPIIMTVYDLMPEVFHERALARGDKAPLSPSTARFADRADRIITISAATRDRAEASVAWRWR